MLDKIKVYRRSDSQEIDLETVRIGFGKNLWLFVGADSSPTEQKLQLTKTDPLNKFKKEIKGWLFCDEYVVLEDIEKAMDYMNIYICHQRVYHSSTFRRPAYSQIELSIYGMGNFKEYYEKSEITNLKKSLKSILNTNEKINIGYSFKSNYFNLGEDKYIKLLELINQ